MRGTYIPTEKYTNEETHASQSIKSSSGSLRGGLILFGFSGVPPWAEAEAAPLDGGGVRLRFRSFSRVLISASRAQYLSSAACS